MDESSIESKRNSLIIKIVIGELLIFLIFGVMLYFYYKSKDEDKINSLVNAIIIFIYLQIILLGLLYTYYDEIKINSNTNNNIYNANRVVIYI